MCFSYSLFCGDRGDPQMVSFDEFAGSDLIHFSTSPLANYVRPASSEGNCSVICKGCLPGDDAQACTCFSSVFFSILHYSTWKFKHMLFLSFFCNQPLMVILDSISELN